MLRFGRTRQEQIMSSATTVIRKYTASDESGVADLCYATGHQGEGLEGRGLFNDRYLFAMLFALYYARYEPEHCFVASDKDSGRITGYIFGTPDTITQEKRFARRMIWRIAARAILYSLWRYPESFRMVLHFQHVSASAPLPVEVRREYPAHLHINVLPGFHARGLGSALLLRFEEHMKVCGASGIHLITSEGNVKAVPFYRKHGYSIAAELSSGFWPDAPGIKSLVFVKRLQP